MTDEIEVMALTKNRQVVIDFVNGYLEEMGASMMAKTVELLNDYFLNGINEEE